MYPNPETRQNKAGYCISVQKMTLETADLIYPNLPVLSRSNSHIISSGTKEFLLLIWFSSGVAEFPLPELHCVALLPWIAAKGISPNTELLLTQCCTCCFRALIRIKLPSVSWDYSVLQCIDIQPCSGAMNMCRTWGEDSRGKYQEVEKRKASFEITHKTSFMLTFTVTVFVLSHWTQQTNSLEACCMYLTSVKMTSLLFKNDR